MAELEQSRSNVLLFKEEMQRANKDWLQGEAPSVEAGGKLGLDGHQQEELWLFVRNRLMAEQENGEHGGGVGQSPGLLAPGAGCLASPPTLLVPSYPGASEGDQHCHPI